MECPDILVNNAGLMRDGTALKISALDWEQTLQVNLTAPFMLTK
jgi:meso-butanediol dehydrogenase/(S,S)-butanediol dehydrogenase/diacetyl reductase